MSIAVETILALLGVAIATSLLILGTLYFVIPALRDRRREPAVETVEGPPSTLPGGAGYLPPSPNLEPGPGNTPRPEQRPEQRKAS